ncbi:thiamine pyrophosphate-dependent enzyme [Bdellovibrionota bacterium FG-2]
MPENMQGRQSLILQGNEAIALAAVHAGVSSAYAYPGTPSTEIMEYLLKLKAKQWFPHAAWCANEKTAYEQGLGVSLVGKRALVAMKHVGLNVAADPFMSSTLVSLQGGLVLVVADDPGMHSSQNEQDTRIFADFAHIPCLEPATPQQAYDMTFEAFDLSERFGVPILLRLVTRLSHSRSAVNVRAGDPGREIREKTPKKAANAANWILMPANAKRQWHALLEKQREFQEFSEQTPYNTLENTGEVSELGVITTGIAREYFLEEKAELAALSGAPAHLHVGVYPFPAEKIRKLAARSKRIVVLEEGYPFVERYLRGILEPAGAQSLTIEGKLSGLLPIEGEMTPELARQALGLPPRKGASFESFGLSLKGRPPQLCKGCPHGDMFAALKPALAAFPQSLVTSDIGCYTLGALEPYSAIESCVCMGASIGMAKGAAEAGFYPVVAVLGDSTFLHSGMTGLLDAVSANTNLTLVILDNEAVAMTGGQKTLIPSKRLKDVVLGLGVSPDHLKIVEAHRTKIKDNTEILRKEIEYPGISVVIAVRECVETAVRSKKQAVQGSAL